GTISSWSKSKSDTMSKATGDRPSFDTSAPIKPTSTPMDTSSILVPLTLKPTVNQRVGRLE
ncbi:unnamed protein product, partial [Ilex paraguariensis]